MRRPYSQVFLKDKNILQKMVQSLVCPTSATVLEIGPGQGDLTRTLLARGYRVVAVEIDGRMVAALERAFPDALREGQLHLIHGDFLKILWADLLSHTPTGEYCVVSNIPYAITGPILERLVEAARWLPAVHLTVQWEVAERMVARPGSRTYGALSVWVQTNYHPRLLFKIKRTSFWPMPEVDSAFVVWIRHTTPEVPYEEQPQFFSWVRTVFRYRRKTLRRIFKDLGILETIRHQIPDAPLDLRPEDLDLRTFYVLFLMQARSSAL